MLASNENEAQECSYICNGIPTFTDPKSNQTLHCELHVSMNETSEHNRNTLRKMHILYDYNTNL